MWHQGRVRNVASGLRPVRLGASCVLVLCISSHGCTDAGTARLLHSTGLSDSGGTDTWHSGGTDTAPNGTGAGCPEGLTMRLERGVLPCTLDLSCWSERDPSMPAPTNAVRGTLWGEPDWYVQCVADDPVSLLEPVGSGCALPGGSTVVDQGVGLGFYDTEQVEEGDSCSAHREARVCQEDGSFDGSPSHDRLTCRQEIYSSEQLNSMPSIAKLPDASFVVTFRQGSDHAASMDGLVMLLHSQNDERSWTSSLHFAPMQPFGTASDRRYNAGPLSVSTLDDGSLMSVVLSYSNAMDADGNWLDPSFHDYAAVSTDGQTWSTWTELFPDASIIASGGVEVVGANLTMPAYGPLLTRSENGGSTWEVYADAPNWPSDYSYSETDAIEVFDDNGDHWGFVAATRAENQDDWHIVTASLATNGSAPRWGDPVPVDDTNEGWNVPDLTRMSDDRILLCYTSTTERAGVNCHLSTDEGRTWAKPFTAHSFSADTHGADQGAQDLVEVELGRMAMVLHESTLDISRILFVDFSIAPFVGCPAGIVLGAVRGDSDQDLVVSWDLGNQCKRSPSDRIAVVPKGKSFVVDSGAWAIDGKLVDSFEPSQRAGSRVIHSIAPVEAVDYDLVYYRAGYYSEVARNSLAATVR